MMVRTSILAVLALMVLSLSGCTDGGSLYTLSMSGANLTDRSGTFEADGDVRLSVTTGGTGTARVVLKDGAGAQAFAQTFGGSTSSGGAAGGGSGCGSASGGAPGSGGSAYSCTVRGAAGTWRVDVDFSNYSGGFTLAVTSS